jgi:hypothetical protein
MTLRNIDPQGGKGTVPFALHFQLRPNPFAN